MKKPAHDWRVAFLTDVHVREVELALHSRLLDAIAAEVEAFRPDVVLLGGDLAGLQVPHKATVGERNVFSRIVARLARAAPVVAVRGNHDFPGDWSFLGLLPDVTWVEGDPAMVTVEASRDGTTFPLGILALPWLDRSRFAVGADYAAQVHETYASAVRASLADRQEVNSLRGIAFVLAHAAVRGGVLRDGQPPVPTEDPLLDLGGLLPPCGERERFAAGFFGHYHSPQDLLGAAMPCRYGGSTFVNEFGEDPARGWTSWTACDGFRHHFVAQPLRWAVRCAAGEAPDVSFVVPGEWLKLIVSVPDARGLPAARVAAAKTLGELAERGVSARVEYEVAHEARSRDGAAETAAAVTMADKFGQWAVTIDPAPPRAPVTRALELLAEIEAGLDGGGA